MRGSLLLSMLSLDGSGPSRFVRLTVLVAFIGLVVGGCADVASDDKGADYGYDIQSFDIGKPNPEDAPKTFACNPCTGSSQCAGAGDKNAKCVDYGKDGAFCGRECASDGDCPDDTYSCKDSTSVEGDKVKQCVTKTACKCSTYAASKSLSTWCSDASGCKGTQKCLIPGNAPECVVQEKKTETCDAIDNDCDGELNEDTCDDNNLCTDDSCNPSNGCVHIGNAKTCDDGSKCTKKDACSDGACKGTDVVSCDDGKDCTIDSCDKAKGCVNKDHEGGVCDDGDGCTSGEKCTSGKCSGGNAKACDDGNACTDDVCKSPKGTCGHNANAATCDDGDKCTTTDKCGGNACLAGAATNCDDANACTNDSCDAKTGCVNAPAAATPCDDGDKCTEKDACAAGKCTGAATKCDDNNACTDDTCDSKSGCKVANNTAKCSDGDACTETDICAAGKCAGIAKTCDDKDKCTKDSCDNKQAAGKECVNLPQKVTGCGG
jgi:hypothetical protein